METVKDNTVKVLVYRGGIIKGRGKGAETLNLPRAPVAGDKLFIEDDNKVAYAYKVIDVHFIIDKGGIGVVVEPLGEVTDYTAEFVARGLM